jgi:hypothetical protein
MKLNAHLEEDYGSATQDVTDVPAIAHEYGSSAPFSHPWAIADRHREDEIFGGAHIIHSSIMEHCMTPSEPEKLICWFHDLHAGTRFFLVTSPLRQAEKQLHTFAAVASPIYRPILGKSSYAGDFTENTIDLVNALFKLGGIKFVFCNAYALQIRLHPDASWASLHDRVIDLLNASLFGGEAEVGIFTQPQAGIRQCWAHLSLAKSKG